MKTQIEYGVQTTSVDSNTLSVNITHNKDYYITVTDSSQIPNQCFIFLNKRQIEKLIKDLTSLVSNEESDL